MKWPDSTSLPEEIVTKLNERIEKFLLEDTREDGANNQEAVEQLLLDMSAIAFSDKPGDEGLHQLNVALAGIEWDTDEPKLVHIQKYFNRVFSGDFASGHTYIERAILDRENNHAQITKTAMARSGASGGIAKNKLKKATIENALQYYHENKALFRSKKHAAQELERRYPGVKFKTYYRYLRNLAR